MEKPKINTEEIPAAIVDALAISFLDSIQKFYNDPKNVAEFEKWKEAQNEN
ncbi:hypothetical protein [Eubacterium limosum]|uniref:hypothetical protein n=1 Tax=Eubacterium limosum TaxID=1736 RepID=UPI0015599AD8|nr:hypothetical protein [Eubacterium limosum]